MHHSENRMRPISTPHKGRRWCDSNLQLRTCAYESPTLRLSYHSLNLYIIVWYMSSIYVHLWTNVLYWYREPCQSVWNKMPLYYKERQKVTTENYNIHECYMDIMKILVIPLKNASYTSSARRQKGLSIYLKQSPVRPFCLQTDDIYKWICLFHQPTSGM